jgi:ferric-dicitrate binding protein FerR (iron transport regulator)
MSSYQPYFDIAVIISKYLRKEITDGERTILADWLSENEGNRELFRKLTDENELNAQIEIFSDIDYAGSWKVISAGVAPEKKIKKPFKTTVFYYAAAALFLLLGFGIVFFQLSESNYFVKRVASHKADLSPGSNKATLTLSNGAKINLADAVNGKIARQQLLAINKTQSGKIVYSGLASLSPADLAAMKTLTAFNTISTPRGGQFEVVLPDGTKVWLNAETSLTYPVIFKGNRRSVTLNGEAYFEVTKNASMPFIVKTSGQTVEVLGTHFNVNSYADESAVKTTLLEGSVRVADNSNKSEVVLQPGQQAVDHPGIIRVVRDADIEEAMAWKNGKFIFRNADLHTIMRQLSRWYDVDVEFQGIIPEKHYRGRISRNVPASQVFEILKTSGINFLISGRKIIVKT